MTPLFHAQVIGGPAGVSFTLGPLTLFAPVEEERLYVVDPTALLIGGPVPEGMAALLAATVLEPRLCALGGMPYAEVDRGQMH